MMIQLYDGRNALYPSNKTTREGAIYWSLNPWATDYKEILVYTSPSGSLERHPIGITLEPDLSWHSFELAVDLASDKYLYVKIDDQPTAYLSSVTLAHVYQPTWGEDVSLNITTESENAYPGNTCGNIFTWTMQYSDLTFSHYR